MACLPRNVINRSGDVEDRWVGINPVNWRTEEFKEIRENSQSQQSISDHRGFNLFDSSHKSANIEAKSYLND